MSLTDLCTVFLVGCMVGFGFGYLVRSLQTLNDKLDAVKEELDEVDETVKRHHPSDAGFVTWEFIGRLALLVVVLVTVWAALSSQSASRDVRETQDFVARVTTCNQEYLAKTIRALNQRTESVQNRADANLELQTKQAAFFSLLLGQPPKSEAVRRDAAQKYLDALTKFVRESNRTEQQADAFPYPTNEELNRCIYTKESP